MHAARRTRAKKTWRARSFKRIRANELTRMTACTSLSSLRLSCSCPLWKLQDRQDLFKSEQHAASSFGTAVRDAFLELGFSISSPLEVDQLGRRCFMPLWWFAGARSSQSWTVGVSKSFLLVSPRVRVAASARTVWKAVNSHMKYVERRAGPHWDHQHGGRPDQASLPL